MDLMHSSTRVVSMLIEFDIVLKGWMRKANWLISGFFIFSARKGLMHILTHYINPIFMFQGQHHYGHQLARHQRLILILIQSAFFLNPNVFLCYIFLVWRSNKSSKRFCTWTWSKFNCHRIRNWWRYIVSHSYQFKFLSLT